MLNTVSLADISVLPSGRALHLNVLTKYLLTCCLEVRTSSAASSTSVKYSKTRWDSASIVVVSLQKYVRPETTTGKREDQASSFGFYSGLQPWLIRCIPPPTVPEYEALGISHYFHIKVKNKKNLTKSLLNILQRLSVCPLTPLVLFPEYPQGSILFLPLSFELA